MTKAILALAALLLLFPSSIEAKGGRSGGGHHSHGSHLHSSHSPSSSGAHRKTYAQGVPRNSKGRIQRSAAARRDFRHSHPCPSTNRSFGACPGYVIDHIKPLKRGGADTPSNMQWQTRAAAKEKDKWE